MKHIAILTCLNACGVCTGASCLRAWNRRERGFAPYAGEDASLEAFFHCGGCGTDPETDDGMLEKLDRLQSIGVDTVHTGICAVKDRETGELCPAIAKIQEMLRSRGIKTIVGTH
ncbi:MAG: CGGC domain-containing protein [Oscillospiraceae bacterium]|nr:CGGC domain-containing protein [Oscillospiraceae bacterium]